MNHPEQSGVTRCAERTNTRAVVRRRGSGEQRLEVPALGLLALDRLEQRLEVADTEAARTVPLDDLEEEGRAILDRSREDLEEVALLVAVGLDAELLERLDRHPDVADSFAQRRVVLMRQAEELDPALVQLPDGPDDVLAPQSDVLAAGHPVPVEELLDLALLLAGRRLVDRELDPAVAVGHDLRHERAVLGVDDLVVVVDQLAEAEDVAIERDELVHLAEPDVANAMVDLEQAEASGRPGRLFDLAIAGGEDAVIVLPIDEAVAGLAVGRDGRSTEHPVLAAVELDRLDRRAGAPLRRLCKRRMDIVDGEGDVLDTVAMGPDVLGDLAVRGQRRREDERDVVASHHIARPVADSGLQTRERDRREAPQGAVVGRRLAGVADPELDMVDAIEREEVLGLRVGVLVDPGAGLVGGAAGDRVGHGLDLPARGGRPTGQRRPDDDVASHATPEVR